MIITPSARRLSVIIILPLIKIPFLYHISSSTGDAAMGGQEADVKRRQRRQLKMRAPNGFTNIYVPTPLGRMLSAEMLADFAARRRRH